jgi:hypothetical protein
VGAGAVGAGGLEDARELVEVPFNGTLHTRHLRGEGTLQEEAIEGVRNNGPLSEDIVQVFRGFDALEGGREGVDGEVEVLEEEGLDV